MQVSGPSIWLQSSLPSPKCFRWADLVDLLTYTPLPGPCPMAPLPSGSLLMLLQHQPEGGAVLVLQGLQALHKQGRGHVDINALNIRIREWQDVSKLHTTLLGLGSSLKQAAGKHLHVYLCKRNACTAPLPPPPPSQLGCLSERDRQAGYLLLLSVCLCMHALHIQQHSALPWYDAMW